jgi:N-succinyldiaminopimelate aminotransferase
LRLSTKWDHVGTSIFSVMTQEAVKAGAVNLAQGFPDFDGPEPIREAAAQALRRGLNQYAPSAGLPELRQALARRQKAKHGLDWNWESEVTVFSGATEALYSALQAFLTPGDEVIALEPAFDSYAPAAHAAGAKVVGVPLAPPAWRLVPEALEHAVTPRTRAILLNTPHNPTGRVLTRPELEAVRAVALAHDLLVITDEVYDELVYAPAVHLPFSTLPGMAERTVTIGSTAKTYSYTGWKIGYAFAPARLTHLVRAVHQFTVFCSATPLQAGMVAALALPESYYDELRREYRERRDFLAQTLTQAGFEVVPPEGTYFVLGGYGRLSDKDDVDFARWLTTEVKVAAIPLSPFYGDPVAQARRSRHVRFAFCKELATLGRAADNLKVLTAP